MPVPVDAWKQHKEGYWTRTRKVMDREEFDYGVGRRYVFCSEVFFTCRRQPRGPEISVKEIDDACKKTAVRLDGHRKRHRCNCGFANIAIKCPNLLVDVEFSRNSFEADVVQDHAELLAGVICERRFAGLFVRLSMSCHRPSCTYDCFGLAKNPRWSKERTTVDT